MTVVVVHRDGAPVAAIGVRDELRPEVPEVVSTLADRGIGVTMLTGDNERVANEARLGVERKDPAAIGKALNVAFRGGSVMGLSVGGFALLGLLIVYIVVGMLMQFANLENLVEMTSLVGLKFVLFPQVLSSYALQVITAQSGPEAIAKVQQCDVDLVLMDDMMPGMDGVEATGHIRALGGKYARLPIIALTANAISGSEAYYLANQMSDYLSKPMDFSSVSRKLMRWLPPEKVVISGG